MDLSNVKVRKGEDLSFHLEALPERKSVSVGRGGEFGQKHQGNHSNALDIVFNLVRVKSTVYKNILDAGIGKKVESIFDQGGICKRKETLGWLARRGMHMDRRGGNYSWSFKGKGVESGLK